MSNACLNCGLCDQTLIEIKEGFHGSKALHLCVPCYDEYRVGYIELVYCDSCNIPFMTEDDPPHTCKSCVTFNVSYPPEWTYDEVDNDGYLPKVEITSGQRPPTGKMCTKKAIRLYVSARQNEDKHILRERAVTFFKIAKGLPDNGIVIGEMARQARELNYKPMEYFRLMADYDRAEEGLVDLVSIAKEQGYMAYMAVDQDAQELHLGNLPFHLMELTAKHPPTLCLEVDDEFSKLPF